MKIIFIPHCKHPKSLTKYGVTICDMEINRAESKGTVNLYEKVAT